MDVAPEVYSHGSGAQLGFRRVFCGVLMSSQPCKAYSSPPLCCSWEFQVRFPSQDYLHSRFALLAVRGLHRPPQQHRHGGTGASQSAGAARRTDLGSSSAQKSWANVQDPCSLPEQHFQVEKDMSEKCEHVTDSSKWVSWHTTHNSELFAETQRQTRHMS